jgi:hypothetical protein
LAKSSEKSQLIRRELSTIIDQCSSGTIAECRIIDALLPVAGLSSPQS